MSTPTPRNNGMKLWSRAFLPDDRMVLYCEATGQYAELVGENSTRPIDAREIPQLAIADLQRGRSTVTEFDGIIYTRVEHSRGWNTPEIEYYRGRNKGQKLPDSEIPEEVKKAFGDQI